MSSPNRATLIAKTNRVLKKHYKPVLPDSKRSVLEHLLFACCLENATASSAEKVFALIKEKFFDLNEVRVSTIRELAEIMQPIGDAEEAAKRLKGVLQSVFESQYSFDLEALRKQNIGQAIKRLQKFEGTTPFTIAYVTQAALGGHAIPVNRGALIALQAIGVISEAEAEKYKVPGLERAISKSKGIEFGSLLHQLGVTVGGSPYSTATRKLLLEIAPDCKDRLPKRPSKSKPVEVEEPTKKVETKKSKKAAEDKPAAEKKKTAAKKAASNEKKTAKKKRPAAKKKKSVPPKKRKTAKKKTKAKAKKKTKSKKSPTKRLAKRKPR